MAFRYCTARHPDGWCCILGEDHARHADPGVRAHLSIDYRVLWHGTPGLPVSWSEAKPAVPVALPGFTGVPCDRCGSPNTVRTGTCLTCQDCGHAGSCG